MVGYSIGAGIEISEVDKNNAINTRLAYNKTTHPFWFLPFRKLPALSSGPPIGRLGSVRLVQHPRNSAKALIRTGLNDPQVVGLIMCGHVWGVRGVRSMSMLVFNQWVKGDASVVVSAP